MTHSDPRVGEIEARLAAARPGPWLVNDEEQTVRVESAEGDEWCGEIMYDRSAEHPTYWVSEFRPDAVFIANAPADVAYLLAELRARDEALGRVEAIKQRLTKSRQTEDQEIAEDLRAAVAAEKGAGDRG